MNQSIESFVTVNHILADVLRLVKDDDFRVQSKGWYTSQIQQALEELSFDTYFNELNEDFAVPEDLRLPMPKGAFNIRQIYLFNGTKCVIGQNSQVVYHKRNYFTGGKGFLSRNKLNTNNRDPFYRNETSPHNVRNRAAKGDDARAITDLYFYNVQNGLIMLSESAKRFERIFIVFNGVSTDIGEAPAIPSFLRQAVKDFTAEKALQMRMSDAIGTAAFNSWQTLWSITNNSLTKAFDGSWAKAEHRVRALDSKEREDLKEYLSKLDT